MDKQQKYAKMARLAVVGIVIAVLSPAIMMMVQGIVGLGIAALIGTGAIAAAPVIGSQFAVWKIKGMKAVARANPVETLQVLFIEKKGQLSQFLERIQTFSAEVAAFSATVDQFRVDYPQEAASFVEHLGKMLQLLELRKNEYRQALNSLDKFDAEIKKAGSIWKMSQAAAQVSKSAGMSDEEVYAKIQSETAIEQVQLSLNQSIAQLDMALLEQESKAPPSIMAPRPAPIQ